MWLSLGKKEKIEINESILTWWYRVGCVGIQWCDWLENIYFIKIKLLLCANYLLYKIAFELKEINVWVKEILQEMFNILRENVASQ